MGAVRAGELLHRWWVTSCREGLEREAVCYPSESGPNRVPALATRALENGHGFSGASCSCRRAAQTPGA